MKIIDFVKSFIKTKEEHKIYTGNQNTDESVFKKAISEISKQKDIAMRLKNNVDFQEFKTEILEKYMAKQMNNLCNANEPGETFVISKKIAAITEIFDTLNTAENADIDGLIKTYNETKQMREEILGSFSNLN